MLTTSLMHHLSIVPDFRQSWKVQHQLSDILFLTNITPLRQEQFKERLGERFRE
jgi:hypothetical protein